MFAHMLWCLPKLEEEEVRSGPNKCAEGQGLPPGRTLG